MAQILYIMVVSSFTLVLTGYDSGQVLMLISSSAAFNPHKSRLEGWLFYNCSDLKWFVSCFVLTHSHTLNKFPGILFCWHNTLHTQQTLLCTSNIVHIQHTTLCTLLCTNNHAHYFALCTYNHAQPCTTNKHYFAHLTMCTLHTINSTRMNNNYILWCHTKYKEWEQGNGGER